MYKEVSWKTMSSVDQTTEIKVPLCSLTLGKSELSFCHLQTGRNNILIIQLQSVVDRIK